MREKERGRRKMISIESKGKKKNRQKTIKKGRSKREKKSKMSLGITAKERTKGRKH